MTRTLITFVVFIFVIWTTPLPAAASELLYSGWLPYWRKASGTPETIAHLEQLAEVSPFSYEVKSDGSLIDRMKINEEPWPTLFAAAKAKKVLIIPTIAWTDGAAIHKVLSGERSRHAHIRQIIGVVTENNFAGIDIDYENKKVESRAAFSAFIRELSSALHAKKKTLSCTIEPRTPPSSRFVVIPKNVEYVNDYRILAAYCDQVRLMTYDQTTADVRLNMAKRQGGYYAPVADDDWVAKVLAETVKTIPARKIMLGVPTYGYEFEVRDKGKYYDYVKLRSLSYKSALSLANSLGIKPIRSGAGELAFTYTKSGMARFVSVSDAPAIAEKIRWATAYKVRGISIFRLDGESDPAIWSLIAP